MNDNDGLTHHDSVDSVVPPADVTWHPLTAEALRRWMDPNAPVLIRTWRDDARVKPLKAWWGLMSGGTPTILAAAQLGIVVEYAEVVVG